MIPRTMLLHNSPPLKSSTTFEINTLRHCILRHAPRDLSPIIYTNSESQASLAYFAKGPLSRARAAFHLDYDSTLDMNELVAFLESLVLTTKLIDKKYSVGMPSCVSLMDVQDPSGDDVNPGKPKKRRSNKKMKLGKDGLYPSEDNFIRKFFSTLEEEADCGMPGSSREERIRGRISQLRARETKLQMIVILEVLALRPLASNSQDLGGDLPAGTLSNQSGEVKDKLAKSKTPEQLSMLIDVHIDRLCIWQDIAAEATHTPLGDSQNPGTEGAALDAPKHTHSILRDFCVEVIGPL